MNDLALIAPQIGVSERTLRRALAEGAIRAERLSPRRLKLPVSEKDYLLRRWPLLGQLRAALRTESNVRFAFLFGSTARGEDSAESDADLLVEMRDSALVRRVAGRASAPKPNASSDVPRRVPIEDAARTRPDRPTLNAR